MDIIDDLRLRTDRVIRDAGDEIERLRTQLEKAEAENEHLKNRLQRFVDRYGDFI